MASLTIKGLPEGLHERLKRVAAKNRRSINQQAIMSLEQALGGERSKADVEAELERIRALRESLNMPRQTDEDIRAAKEWGRH